MRLAKILGIILICCLVDGFARSFLIEGIRVGLGGLLVSTLYYTTLILGVGDIFYYIVFALTFELVYSRFQRREYANLAIFIGGLLALACFLLFGSQRFYISGQMVFMAFAYGIIGSLYGFLHHKWIVPAAVQNS